MAYGKPVITTASFGTADYVRHGVDGLTYRGGDAGDLREQLRRITSDQPLRERLGRAAYERVLTSFTFELHAAAKLRAIRELAERPTS
jgi:glycosyltransferase involved in cell wall biosynthesis